MLIRNDDVCAGTGLHEIQTLCEICDRYGVGIIQCITAIGHVQPIDCRMDNAEIRRVSGTALFRENREVVEYMRGRKEDRYAIHGLWHTHEPSYYEIMASSKLITELEFNSSSDLYYVPPFNEGKAENCPRYFTFCGKECPRLEEYLEAGDPGAEIVYLHSWRFEHGPFTWEQLDRCLNRLTR